MRQAIIFASFGSADSNIRAKTMDAVAHEIQSTFKDIEVRQAYTANFMRRKMKAQGMVMPSIEEQIAALRSDNFDEIFILPSHLTPGEEFDLKIKPFAADDVKILSPVFSLNCDTDFDQKAFEVVVNCFKTVDDEELVLIGHGSPHRHNTVYENLQRIADNKNIKVHIGVIELTDTPNFDDVNRRLKNNAATKLLLATLLFNGGVHVAKDIAGDDKSSWKSRLINEGYNIRICTDGLGTFKNFRQLYIDKLMNELIA